MVFLLTVIAACSSARSATLPVAPREATSSRKRWLSVPPETMRKPRSESRPARRAALSTMLRLVSAKLLGLRLPQRHRLGGDDVHQRSALDAGEDGAVDVLGELGLAQDHAGARTAQRLVRGGGDEVAVRHRRRVLPRRHQAGDVRDVGHQQAAGLVGDRAKAREVDDAAVGRGAADDQPRPLGERQPPHLVEIDALALAVDAVGDDSEVASGVRQPVAVREMAAAARGPCPSACRPACSMAK